MYSSSVDGEGADEIDGAVGISTVGGGKGCGEIWGSDGCGVGAGVSSRDGGVGRGAS